MQLQKWDIMLIQGEILKEFNDIMSTVIRNILKSMGIHNKIIN